MNQNIFNKQNLAEKLHEEGFSPVKARCEEAVETIFESIVEALKQGKKVSIRNIGIFSIKQKSKSEARNPKTGEKVVVPAHNKVKFTASSAIKEAINK
jgi:nucleoid DNA-binding protein